MRTAQKNNRKPNSSRTHGMRLSALVLSLSIFGLMLNGCASSPPIIENDCPKPLQVPASILQSDSTAVSDFSKRVQAYLLKVQKFLSESAESTTP